MKQKLILVFLLLTPIMSSNNREGLCSGIVNVYNDCGVCFSATVGLACGSTPCGSGFVNYPSSGNFEVPAGAVTVLCSCEGGITGHIRRTYDTIVYDDEISNVTFTCGLDEFLYPCTILQLYDKDSEEVEALRVFRDNVLSKTQEGRELITLYYQWSPVIVKAMEQDEEFKQEIKDIVDEILPMIGGEQ